MFLRKSGVEARKTQWLVPFPHDDNNEFKIHNASNSNGNHLEGDPHYYCFLEHLQILFFAGSKTIALGVGEDPATCERGLGGRKQSSGSRFWPTELRTQQPPSQQTGQNKKAANSGHLLKHSLEAWLCLWKAG